MNSQPLDMWVIYDRPSDFPQGFIARRWEVLREERATDDVLTSDNLEQLRFTIQREKFCSVVLPRFENDDPKIVEVWM
ncbi:hypothetical protein [Novosphingobium sp. ST904]|uniref:hypothetical protein n=1 Tax=Novosphingobium sp. ST904 TaxID=1684385 RepID=UPI0006C8A0D9|nr:hypothetical protein [Novosphingobium sp. ST904]KPH68610.1 hypothetical protein ADT71_01035 [Novosphingobium sp. ST904]TCM23034.1 hypothetical protein EDF59_1606 [Novosphingobium sp. ST904]